MKQQDIIRALLNDSGSHVFTDERLAPFIDQANSIANVYAAFLVAVSVGAVDCADRLRILFPQRSEQLDEKKLDKHFEPVDTPIR